MAKRLAQNVEEYLKKQKAVHLEHLLRTWGIPVDFFEPVQDTYSKVYGTDAGLNKNIKPIFNITVIVTGDDFFPTSSTSAGSFKEGWLYSNDPRVTTSQIVELPREDGTTRRYRIDSTWTRGTTLAVFKRWKLVAMDGI